jgi:hypothetical protein
MERWLFVRVQATGSVNLERFYSAKGIGYTPAVSAVPSWFRVGARSSAG